MHFFFLLHIFVATLFGHAAASAIFLLHFYLFLRFVNILFVFAKACCCLLFDFVIFVFVLLKVYLFTLVFGSAAGCGDEVDVCTSLHRVISDVMV